MRTSGTESCPSSAPWPRNRPTARLCLTRSSAEIMDSLDVGVIHSGREDIDIRAVRLPEAEIETKFSSIKKGARTGFLLRNIGVTGRPRDGNGAWWWGIVYVVEFLVRAILIYTLSTHHHPYYYSDCQLHSPRSRARDENHTSPGGVTSVWHVLRNAFSSTASRMTMRGLHLTGN